ncbi:MAG: DNA-directed DNA polymerase [Methyloligella sp.]|nr:MAG: DNA-directed DNA polymerase [Methyloligella sp.]
MAKPRAKISGNTPKFIHLRVHSAYSLLEGALPVERLVNYAVDENMPALGLTDTNNLFGALEFSEKCVGKGVQPLIGCTLDIKMPSLEGEAKKSVFEKAQETHKTDGEIALIAQNEQGYQNLMALTSIAFLDTAGETDPFITNEFLSDHSEGLILLSGGEDGPLDLAIKNNQADLAGKWAALLKETFKDRFYIELQRHGRPSEKRREQNLIETAYALDIPLVATNEAYFDKREDYEAHDALICVADGAYVSEDERRRLTPDHHLKSARQMAELFKDIPEAIENTVEIAKRCSYRPTTHAPILPNYLSSDEQMDNEEKLEAEAKALRDLAEKGLEERLSHISMPEGMTKKDYVDRLNFELDIIISMKFPGYFLIVADFIQWSKNNNIAVGPGRGSGAGSVVAWVLTITDLDPLRFGLLFERFLNPERVSMPDFDIDFCQTRRDEVIRYVQQKYGDDKVAQIITFGKLQARAVLRDVGRVLSMPYGQVDRLCKMVPNNPANPCTLSEALIEEPKLAEARRSEKVVDELLTIALKLEGLYRHASTHAAGVVIGDRPLTQLVPLYRDPKSDIPVTQFNMKWVEPAGLVKFDFLGLKTLTVIEKAREFIAANGTELDIPNLPLDDKLSYELLAKGETIGVFQLESTGMRDSLKKLRPDRFEDIIAMVSLYRPGPMDNIPTYIARKQGDEEPDYYHDMLKPVLEETYGVIIYQEQVMQIAQIMAGYSLGEADMLRRAMGKKIKEEMARQKARFVEGAEKNNVDKKQAEFIFEQVDKFAGYGFNKSHAAAYALLAYQTAYLRANHPVEFLAASMTLDLGNTDKLSMFANEARRIGIETKSPDVNASEIDFLPRGNTILYSMAALKNIGTGAVASIVQERKDNGNYNSLSDFANRFDPKAINKRGLETLSCAGAFDQIEPDRAKVHANAERIAAVATKLHNDRKTGQSDLFGGSSDAGTPDLELLNVQRWREMEKLTREYDAVGFYLSGHPLDEYEAVLDRLNVDQWVHYEKKALDNNGGLGVLAATVSAVRERRSKSGNLYAFIEFSDQTGQFEAIAFSDTLEACRDILESGQPVLLKVDADVEEDTVRLRLQKAESLEFAAQNMVRGLKLTVTKDMDMAELAKALGDHQGRGKIKVGLILDDFKREVEMDLPGKYSVSLERASDLRTLKGILSVTEI